MKRFLLLAGIGGVLALTYLNRKRIRQWLARAFTKEAWLLSGDGAVKIKCLIHEAEEGGFWAEVPSLPGCFTEGETWEEVLSNLREAIACYLGSPELDSPLPPHTHVEALEV